MEEAEGFLFGLGASLTKKGARSLHAVVAHPDGFKSNIAVNYHSNGEDAVLEFARRSGDPTLFHVILAMFHDFDMGRGRTPIDFYHGQILPRLFLSSSPPPFDVPALRLDGGGPKRKACDAVGL